ncbi:MAG: glutathione S-transferase [Caulobacter sp.]|nr:glutathione S-transferase [Caulobacter sp.]
MITLYHCFNARSFRPLWALEELGVAYDLRMLPFPPRARAKDYLAENPLGTIPLMVEGDTRMTESAAICQYLADRHGQGTLGVPVNDPAYGAYLNYLHFGEATLTFPQTLVLRYGRFEPEERRQPQVAEDYGRWFLARLKAALPALENGFVCAGRFTAADISVGYALLLADQVGLGPRLPEAARTYWEALKTRPGYARAQAAQSAAAKAQGISADW